MRLSKSEIRRVRKGADQLAKDTQKAITTPDGEGVIYACEAVGFGHLAKKMREFYQPPFGRNFYGHEDHDKWGDLPYGLCLMTKESQLQRELMLELFAHLEGVV